MTKRYHSKLMYLSLFFMSATVIYLLSVFKELTARVQAVSGNDELAAEMLFVSIDHILIVTVSCFFIYFLFTLLFVLFIEQKVGGPTVAILKFIEELKKKNYDYKRNLRKGDELESIMAALKDLQQDLKVSSNNRSQEP
ncbi:MAG: hypothetical protein IT287_05945 [Bdellovibrionaceae bacterium]|nr:hypothetical protein [Pseudobdellovibrionaceae bacterium]